MMDVCTVQRKTGESTSGGVITPTWSALYTGKCRVQVQTRGAGNGTDVGEAYRVIERREIHLPITVLGLTEGDRITVTASALDPDLVGRVYVVRDVIAKSQLTARRAQVIEVTS